MVSRLESQCGSSIEVQGIGSARGLKKLMDREAEVALLAGSLDLIVNETNKKDPGTVKDSEIQYSRVYRHHIVIAVNASNPVAQVTSEQARQIFSGKVRNWKEVGGPDLGVDVILASKGEGARLEVQKQLLDGADFSARAREMSVATDVPKALEGSPGGIGSIPVTHLSSGIKRFEVGREIVLPLGLAVRRGESGKNVLCIVGELEKLSR